MDGWTFIDSKEVVGSIPRLGPGIFVCVLGSLQVLRLSSAVKKNVHKRQNETLNCVVMSANGCCLFCYMGMTTAGCNKTFLRVESWQRSDKQRRHGQPRECMKSISEKARQTFASRRKKKLSRTCDWAATSLLARWWMEKCTCRRAPKITQCSYMIVVATTPTVLFLVFFVTDPAEGSYYKPRRLLSVVFHLQVTDKDFKVSIVM